MGIQPHQAQLRRLCTEQAQRIPSYHPITAVIEPSVYGGDFGSQLKVKGLEKGAGTFFKFMQRWSRGHRCTECAQCPSAHVCPGGWAAVEAGGSLIGSQHRETRPCAVISWEPHGSGCASSSCLHPRQSCTWQERVLNTPGVRREYGRPHRGPQGPHPTSRPEDSPGICLARLQVAGPQVALTVAPRREGCASLGSRWWRCQR